MQWTAASCRILAKLLLEGKISVEAVAQYLSYNVKIAGLAHRYVWSTVLLYDREYRRSQSTYKFPWGSDVPHLVSVHLVPKSDTSKLTPVKAHRAEGSRPNMGGERSNGYQRSYPCNLYNKESGCTYGINCRFQHVCNICKGPHQGFSHNK